MLLFAIVLATASIQAQQAEVTAASCVVYGAVRSPGRFEFRWPVRLAEILVIAGGVAEAASGVINIIHTGRSVEQNTNVPSEVYKIAELKSGDQRSNPYLEAGDIIIVTELDPIYVTGSVVKPRAIYPKEPLTLTRAIRLAGGVTSEAKTSKVMIYRQKKDAIGSISITVDLQAARKHSAQDPILQLYDIVDVGATGRLMPLMPRLSHPTFDSRPLIPPGYRVIY